MSEWISVKDRMPEKSGDYIVFGIRSRTINILHYSKKNNAFNSYDEFEPMIATKFAIRQIAYWMPLPEPPTVEE